MTTMRRMVLLATLLAALPLLGGCWVSAGTRVGLDDEGTFVSYSSPIFSVPGPGFGTHLGVHID